jgi:hypothetical protein
MEKMRPGNGENAGFCTIFQLAALCSSHLDYLKERSDFLNEEGALSFHFGAKR